MDELEKAFLGVGWAFPVTSAPQGDIQTAVLDEDVRQAIRIILGTNQGERLMRPDFGAGLRAILFEPLTQTTLVLAQHYVEQALIAWEPRIDLISVRAAIDPTQAGRLLITINYRVRATNSFYNLVYPFYLLEGAPT